MKVSKENGSHTCTEFCRVRELRVDASKGPSSGALSVRAERGPAVSAPDGGGAQSIPHPC